VGSAFDELRVWLKKGGFGVWNVWLRSHFEGSVLDRDECNLVIQYVGKKMPDEAEMHGQWTIISGACGEAALHGRGTWRGIAGTVWYEGQVHFGPN
jgi:hypothetical protein